MPRILSDRGAMSLTGAMFGGLLLLVAALLFVGIYVALPQNDHFFALITIGILSLLFAVGGYFGQAVTRDPGMVRLTTYGFLGMGFAVLLLTIALAPGNPLTLLLQIVGLVLVLILLAGVAALAYWRAGTLGREAQRQERRQEWASSPPPSALTYAAAQRAPTPPPQAGPAGGTPPARSGGNP